MERRATILPIAVTTTEAIGLSDKKKKIERSPRGSWRSRHTHYETNLSSAYGDRPLNQDGTGTHTRSRYGILTYDPSFRKACGKLAPKDPSATCQKHVRDIRGRTRTGEWRLLRSLNNKTNYQQTYESINIFNARVWRTQSRLQFGNIQVNWERLHDI